eukprot:CAMPEP_0196637970 /NCGR_PEP_ID=MMETSP1085-20130531/850_1 /TAXON_ID=41879 ORGANISM="Pycnococcus sp, Strain CCMP1998" /NCGR_SAMPLE_ID=MMETSP1085 /ASSEMBLY_ACC=CAM_ASM_000807 /LENGTH=264 /DNA_ID=CAMNT_0041966609 /DNA_START=3 /DNA_END=795 /DNA_ORIENTATION=-
MPHRGPAVRAVPRRLEGLQVVQDPAHRPLVQGLADHDGGPARPRREHRPNLGGPDVLVAQGLRLLNHVHHLVHVIGAKNGVLAVRHRAHARYEGPAVPDVEPVLVEDVEVVRDHELLHGGHLQRDGVNQRLPVELGVGLEALKVENLVRGVLVHDEDVPAQPANEEAQVELANHVHPLEVSLVEDPPELLVGLRLPSAPLGVALGVSAAAAVKEGGRPELLPPSVLLLRMAPLSLALCSILALIPSTVQRNGAGPMPEGSPSSS